VIPWITYVDAITEALRVEMRRDPTVLCLAEASTNGTTPRPTAELLREFGPSRVSEHDGVPSMLAAAAAAASEGMRPVCELDRGHPGDGDRGQLAEAARSGPSSFASYRMATGANPPPAAVRRCLASRG
jgi:hypothetical protein